MQNYEMGTPRNTNFKGPRNYVRICKLRGIMECRPIHWIAVEISEISLNLQNKNSSGTFFGGIPAFTLPEFLTGSTSAVPPPPPHLPHPLHCAAAPEQKL